jgi:hypothetical protein
MNETLLSGRFLISLMQEVGRMTRGRGSLDYEWGVGVLFSS